MPKCPNCNHVFAEQTSLLDQAEAPPADNPKPAKGGTYPGDFESFWNAMPRSPNASKKDAYGAWMKTQKKRPPINILVRCAEAYASDITARQKMRPKDPPPVCHPSTWLNGHRWESYMSAVEKAVAKAAADALAPAVPKWAESILLSIPRAEFDIWFKGVDFDPGPPPRLIVPNSLARDRMQIRYAHFLDRCLGAGVKVEVRRSGP